MNRIACSSFVLLAFALCAAAADPPAWWLERGVLRTGLDVVVNDFAAANAGQLKWFVANACDELAGGLPGGAGSDLSDRVAALSLGNDYAAVNAGQLKSAVALFHSRFEAEGFTAFAPWTAEAADDADFALVNVGQLKHAFAWDLGGDADANGLADWWQAIWLPDCPSGSDADLDGDGWNNAAEFHVGTNPRAVDSDGDGLVDALDPHPRDGSDSDGDGLGDDWERYWFGTLERDGAGDFDFDGASDRAEYESGTNPTVNDVAAVEEDVLLEIHLPVDRKRE